jgi:hypothetical protein
MAASRCAESALGSKVPLRGRRGATGLDVFQVLVGAALQRFLDSVHSNTVKMSCVTRSTMPRRAIPANNRYNGEQKVDRLGRKLLKARSRTLDSPLRNLPIRQLL